MSELQKTFRLHVSGLPGLIIFLLLLVVCWWVLSFFFGIFSMSFGRALSYIAVGFIGYLIGEAK